MPYCYDCAANVSAPCKADCLLADDHSPAGIETQPAPYTPAPIRRPEGWSDGRYIIELEYVLHKMQKELHVLREVRALLAVSE